MIDANGVLANANFGINLEFLIEGSEKAFWTAIYPPMECFPFVGQQI